MPASRSSLAALAAEYGLRVYQSDGTLSDHARRSNPIDHPLMHEFRAMHMDERWVNRSPSVMLETFHGFQGEMFEFIVDDLLPLPADPPIVAEGFRLLPRLVAPLLSRTDQAVWLVPAPEFRRAAFEARGFTWEIPRKTSDPQRALANLLARDALFTAQITTEATAMSLPVIAVDGDRSIDDVTRLVGQALRLPGAVGQ